MNKIFYISHMHDDNYGSLSDLIGNEPSCQNCYRYKKREQMNDLIKCKTLRNKIQKIATETLEANEKTIWNKCLDFR